MSIFLNHPFQTAHRTPPPPPPTIINRRIFVRNAEENIGHNEAFGDIQKYVKLQNRQT
jgi:hypothetical protein